MSEEESPQLNVRKSSKRAVNKITLFQPLLIIAILGVALVLRLIFLDTVPPGLANDEANIILNAQSLIKTGSNTPGVVTGIIGEAKGDWSGGIHSEISSYTLIPFYLLFGFSWPLIKLPFIAASLGISLLLYLIVKELINKNAALVVLALSIFNPWLIHFGRSGYESILSTFFYLLGFYLILRLNSWKILFALPFFLAGFLSYFSAKTLFLPLVLISLIAVRLLKKESLKYIFILNILAFVFVAGYYLLLQNSASGNRIKELSNTRIADTVNWNRAHSISYPFEETSENKYVEDLKYRINASIGLFSPIFLFLNGKPENIRVLQIPDHGPLYLIELLTVGFGLVFLFRNYPKQGTILVLLVISTLVPNFLNLQGTTYWIRVVYLYSILTVISGIGIYGLYKSIQPKTVRLLSLGLLTGIYGFLVLNFAFQYYYRLPIHNNESFFFADRVATRYINGLIKENPNQEVVWVSNLAHFTFYRYAFFSNSYQNREDIIQVNNSSEKGSNRLKNVTITPDCPEKLSSDVLYILDSTAKCPDFEPVALIADINDAGAEYKLPKDLLCKDYTHNRYPLIKEHRLLNVESLTNKEFCENFISNNQQI